jgi:hypothetical protein
VIKKADHDSGFCDDACGLYDGIESLRIIDGYFAQHLSVQGDVGLFQAIDKDAVAYAPLPACGAEPNNPQAAEITFSALAIDPGVDAGADTGFFRETDLLTGSAAITPDVFENTFLRLAPCGAFSYSWHVSFPLKKCISLRLLAAAEWEATQAEKQAISID